MEMITKGIAKRLEFGEEGNWGTLIPEDISIVTYDNFHIHAAITWNYGKGDGRTINLCHDKLDEIDFESFGTTFEAELEKIGYKVNEVQKFRDKWYIIKEEDGTIVPFERFEVKFDYVHPGTFGYTENKVITCEARGEERAIKYAERCVDYSSWMHNITVLKVGNVNE